MTYWLIVTTIQNLKVIRKKHVVGIPERNKGAFQKVQKGDKCVIYTRQDAKPGGELSEPAITGVFEVVSSGYDNTQIFVTPPSGAVETFPLRLNLRPATPFVDVSVPFKPLIEKLSFILNRKSWGSYLQGRGLIPLSEKDYQVIASSLQKPLT